MPIAANRPRSRGPAPAGRHEPPTDPPTDSLAHALLGAARVCLGVREGRTLRDGLERERRESPARPGPHGNDPHAAIHDLAAETLRRRGRADALLQAIAGRVPDPPLLRELLVVAIAQVVDALASTAPSFDARIAALPYPPFTLVDQAVRAVASQPLLARGKGFVNAVLRTLLRRLADDPDALNAIIDAVDEARYELPGWWLARLQTAYPDDWRRIVAVCLEKPPLVVRVNRRRMTRDAYLAQLSEAGLAARALGDDAVRFDRPLPVARIPGFADGVVSVQDEAAQRAAVLLDVAPGMRVLDACAAPGGKTGHIAERADLDLVAIDSDPARVVRIRENLDRLKLAATLVTGDAARPAGWWDGRGFDRILVDVPCTASGIVRRHPDIRWLRRETDIADLSRRAQQITDALWPLVNPGGRLLLVTCSVFPEESARHAERFAARHADATMLAAPGQLLPDSGDARSPTAADHDGLFFAVFARQP